MLKGAPAVTRTRHAQADVWHWYEAPSAYGQGVRARSGGRGPNLAYFLPHLSAVQLLTTRAPRLPQGRSPVVYHTPNPPGAPSQVRHGWLLERLQHWPALRIAWKNPTPGAQLSSCQLFQQLWGAAARPAHTQSGLTLQQACSVGVICRRACCGSTLRAARPTTGCP